MPTYFEKVEQADTNTTQRMDLLGYYCEKG